LLVKEAGGFISDYRGQDRMVERREYLAASGELHSRLHKLLAARFASHLQSFSPFQALAA
jgi:hypothetical protein